MLLNTEVAILGVHIFLIWLYCHHGTTFQSSPNTDCTNNLFSIQNLAVTDPASSLVPIQSQSRPK